MSQCQIIAKAGPTEVQVLIVGHSVGGAVPPVVENEAARLAQGASGDHSLVLVDAVPWLLLRVVPEPWLVGGESWRIAGARLAALLREQGRCSATVSIAAQAGEVTAFVEGILLGDYRYTDCRSGKAATRTELTIRLPGQAAAVVAGVQAAQAQNLARWLADSPPNRLQPGSFVKRIRKEVAGTGLGIRVIEGVAALEKAGFPGLVTVGRAGSAAPALVELRYRPTRVIKKGKKEPHLALVGKGLTFDSGGLSLKPADEMWTMKGDMAGAAAVLGAMRLIAAREVPVTVTAYLALAENLVDRDGMRPGDIYRARNGTFIHVDNTDAEGRLVLADVLTYACEQGATHLVDAATLTGACMVALGLGVAGVMGRHADWVEEVRSAGQDRGEEFWPLPLYGEYRKLLDHPHADLNNRGGKWAGALLGGIFLAEFVAKEVRWAHCDIAGPAMRVDGWRAYAKGNTGFGVRTLARLAERLAAQA